MAVQSNQEFRELVRSHTDLVGLIGESISLQPRNGGRLFLGLCPFHDDKNPSLNVYPDRQTFRCWSCQTGGDCFTFLMEREKITFPEALELLARRANLEIPKTLSRPTNDQDGNRARVFEVLQWAENQYHTALIESPEAAGAREYLRGRGFSDEFQKANRLGFHPEDWTWLLKKAQGKYPAKLLEEARLVGNKAGRQYDYFTNRVIFPIHNERGQPVSFGGRILPGSQEAAKYFNGPESVVFHKSNLIYGLYAARDAIRKSEQAIVVEGYVDCLMCRVHGIENVVATLGTALTDQHVTILKRFAKQVVVVFDGDDAGQNAARKSVERFLSQDVELRIFTPPEKLDPAEFLIAYNADEFRKQLSRAPEGWDFQFSMSRAKYGGNSIASRQRILEEMLELLAKAPNMNSSSLREELLLANLAQRLQIPDAIVRDEFSRQRSQRDSNSIERRESHEIPQLNFEIDRILKGRMSNQEKVECDLLEQIFAVPESVEYVISHLNDSPLKSVVFQSLLDECLWEVEEQGSLTLAGLLGRVEYPELKSLIVWIDAQAVAKGLAAKIRESGMSEDGCYELLKKSLHHLRFRQELQEQKIIASQLSQQTNGMGRLDESMEEALLRQAAEFHLKRANRRLG